MAERWCCNVVKAEVGNLRDKCPEGELLVGIDYLAVRVKGGKWLMHKDVTDEKLRLILFYDLIHRGMVGVVVRMESD